MATFTVRRRFFHRGEMQKIGDMLELDPAEAGRLAHLGYVTGPAKQPRQARKRRRKNDRDPN